MKIFHINFFDLSLLFFERELETFQVDICLYCCCVKNQKENCENFAVSFSLLSSHYVHLSGR